MANIPIWYVTLIFHQFLLNFRNFRQLLCVWMHVEALERQEITGGMG